MKALVPQEIVEQQIFVIRGQRVMIDHDLAELYAIETKYLNRQVKRNIIRFPKEFMFRLTKNEKVLLIKNFPRFNALKHSTSLPLAFTENGVAMLSAVLNSERAIKMSIYIIKTFVRIRQILQSNKMLAEKIEELECKYDKQFQIVFDAIKQLIQKENEPRNPLGFKIENK